MILSSNYNQFISFVLMSYDDVLSTKGGLRWRIIFIIDERVVQ